MSILRILQHPDPRLRIKAKPVENVKDKRIQQIIDDMLETFYDSENCAGLSATQLDIKNPPSITVLDVSPELTKTYCLINPVITSTEGMRGGAEGCMSVYPGEIYAEVKRPEKITVEALDREGKKLKLEVDGYLAKCIQHEVDHLNGILFIDYLSPLKRKMIDKKIKKLSKK